VLCIAALASLTLIATSLPETLSVGHRRRVDPSALWSGTKMLLSDGKFVGLTFVGGFGMASFFVFVASASFVYTGQYGLSPTGFSLAFAANAIGFFAASQLAAPFGARFGAQRVVAVATMGFAACACATFLMILFGADSFWVLVGGLFLGNACLGLVIPTVMVLALDDHGEEAGLASSLGGTMQMLTGGLMIGLASPFFDGTALPMIAAIAICGLLALSLVVIMLPRSRVPA
jgi:DHA1 family bicyclomycin/chloramphenicol resistance-like MFS transporter